MNNYFNTGENRLRLPQDYDATLFTQLSIIPWDVQTMISRDLSVFGHGHSGPNTGKIVKFKARKKYPDKRSRKSINGMVGQIIYDFHGRYVLEIEYGFLGWVEPDELEILDVQIPAIKTIN